MTNLQLLLMHRKVTGFDVQHTTTRKTQHVLRRKQDQSKLQKIHNTLSKMSVVLLRLAQLLMPVHGLKHRLVWSKEHDVSRTITTPPDILHKFRPPPPESSFLGYPINLTSIPLVVKRHYEGAFFQ